MALGPTPLVRLASETGCDGLAIDGECWTSLISLIAAEGARSGLPTLSIVGPQPEARLGIDKRLPALSAWVDKEERLAAINLCRRLMQLGRDVGVGLIALDFGAVPLVADEAALRYAFSRRQLGEDEPGARPLGRAIAQRRALSETILDACRAALDRLVRDAEKIDTTLSITIASGPWQTPSPREAAELLREFSGGPLGVVIDPGRLAALDSWGVGASPARLDELCGRANLIHAADAVGLDTDLLPGLGEAPFAMISRAPGKADLPVVLTGRPDSSEAEVRRARTLLRDLRARPANP